MSPPIGLVVLCVVYFHLAGLAINVGYHRILSHRAATLSRWFERLIITLGLPAGTPIQWAGNHRHHHARTDQPGDPHSPHLDGFWFAHVGWYIQTHAWLPCLLYSLAGPLRTLYDGWHRPRTNQEHNHLAPDVAADPYYRFISRPVPYLLFAVAHVAVFFGSAFWLWGWKSVATLWVVLALIYNLGDAIDSVCHLFGTRPYASRHLARNHWLVGYLTLGEWHANHHQFPFSANTALFPGQWDYCYQMVRVLKALGLARNVKLATPELAQATAARGGVANVDAEPVP